MEVEKYQLVQARIFVWEGWVCSVARVGLSVHNPRILCTSITSRTLSGKAGKTQYRCNYSCKYIHVFNLGINWMINDQWFAKLS